MQLSPYEREAVASVLGPEALTLIEGKAVGRSKNDAAHYSARQLKAVLRASAVGIALALSDVRDLAEKASAIVSELENRSKDKS